MQSPPERSAEGRDEPELARLRARIEELEREVAGAREAERLWRRERDRAQRYLDVAEVALLVLGVDERVQLINRKGVRMLGAADENEVVGRNWFDTFVPAEERESLRGVFHELMTGRAPHLEYFQNRVVTRAGEVRVFAWHNALLRDESGDIVASLSSGEDVTHAERTAQALGESERKFRRIAETAIEGVWTIDEHGVTTFANESMAQMIGYTPDEMLGRPMFDFMDEDAQRTATRNMERRRQGVREVHEFRLTHRDGHAVLTTMATSPIYDDDGKYLGALAMVTDITEKRRAEHEHAALSAKMLERQRLESLGVLAGGIAHDFNNMLAAIVGHVELAANDPSLSSLTRHALETALTAAERAAGLTRQLLDYAGRGRLVSRTVDVAAHTADTVRLLRASIPKRIHVELVTLDAELAISADPDALQQTTTNLLLNAAESYGDSSGRVCITVGSIWLDGTPLPHMHSSERVQAGDYVFVEVRDEGPGMDGSTLARIFEPFFTTKLQGRGLGLAACLGVVRSQSGHLTVRSAIGQGTTFCVYFPRVRAETMPSAHDVAALRPSPMRVLVVDDEGDVRSFVRELLTQHGHSVLEADSGENALRVLRERASELDVVLLDLSMPGLDGAIVLGELQSFAPALPVIVQSGYAAETTAERLRAFGVRAVLQKPYRSAQLLEALEALVLP